MLVFIISLTLFYLSLNYGDPLLEKSEVYHTLFGDIGSMQDLFLKEPDGTRPTPAPEADPAADDNDTLDKLDLEIADVFGFLRTNLTSQTFDLQDYFNINEEYTNFTKDYKNRENNITRRVDHWVDPDDTYFGENLEEFKKYQLKMIIVQYTMHCRYEAGKALLQREPIRDDKRYKLGYLFNRMRRLKTEQLKMVGTAWKQESTMYKHLYTLMRLYERVVHFDVDMRDTAKMIKDLFNQDEPYDSIIIDRRKKSKRNTTDRA